MVVVVVVVVFTTATATAVWLVLLPPSPLLLVVVCSSAAAAAVDDYLVRVSHLLGSVQAGGVAEGAIECSLHKPAHTQRGVQPLQQHRVQLRTGDAQHEPEVVVERLVAVTDTDTTTTTATNTTTTTSTTTIASPPGGW